MQRSGLLFLLMALTLLFSMQAERAMARSVYAHALQIKARRDAYWRHHTISRATRKSLAPDVLVRQQAYWTTQQRSRAYSDIPDPPQ